MHLLSNVMSISQEPVLVVTVNAYIFIIHLSVKILPKKYKTRMCLLNTNAPGSDSCHKQYFKKMFTNLFNKGQKLAKKLKPSYIT